MDKEKFLSWRTAVIISYFTLAWVLANTTDNPLWWFLFVFGIIINVSGAIKNGHW